MASRIGAVSVPSQHGTGSVTSSSVVGSPPLEAPLTSVATAATEWAPRGRIIDDTARGTIFWEADNVDEGGREGGGEEGITKEESVKQEEESGKPEEGQTAVSPTGQSDRETAKLEPAIASSTPMTSTVGYGSRSLEPSASVGSHGSFPSKAFQITWISVKKLPFYKCRGLRNQWNANREVKIARDGTEVETVVGKKLMSFFGAPGYPGR